MMFDNVTIKYLMAFQLTSHFLEMSTNRNSAHKLVNIPYATAHGL